MNNRLKSLLNDYSLITQFKCLTTDSMYCELYFMNVKIGIITLQDHIYCYYPCNSIFKTSGLLNDFLNKLKFELDVLFRRCN